VLQWRFKAPSRKVDLMALPISFLSLTMADNTNNAAGQPTTSNTEVPVIGITAANFTAQAALHAALINALEGITIGNPFRSQIVSNREQISSVGSNDPLAQRENKWLLRYHGSTLNQKFQVSLATADLTQLVGTDHTEFLDLSGGTGAALKSAFEAVVRSPDDGSEAVVLDSVQYVGRNI